MDYVCRAMGAIIEDFRIVTILPQGVIQMGGMCQAKYDRLSLFLQGLINAEDLAQVYYNATIVESMQLNPNSPMFFPHPEDVIQIGRVHHLDTILRTAHGDLVEALKQAKPELVKLLQETCGE